MLVLYESSLGYCLIKVKDGNLLSKSPAEQRAALDSDDSNLLKLQSVHRFSDTAAAVEEITAIGEGKISKSLKKFLTEELAGGSKKSKKDKEEQLVVSDPKLGGAIAKKLSLSVVSDSTTQDLFRGIREQLSTLLAEEGVDERDLATMSLGLSHSLSRYKLKFSPDKVDTMVVQAIALLDDLDKEINIYAMRVKEWYGWHFPEMAKIISDNLAYAKVVKQMGFRTNSAATDFSEILPEDLEEVLKASAQISMGTEISATDLQHIHLLADQVISISNYRAELYSYLTNRMQAIAPNLTALVGELVGARLIAHAGSLMTLAKHPASTIQILGAEKALFRALKTKHDTPKYGLIFHASLVGQAPQKLKGKMARMVATKTALSVRIDALSDADTKSSEGAPIQGIENRAKLESRLRMLEQGMGITGVRRAGGAQGAGAASGMNKQAGKFELKSNGATYNAGADTLIPSQPSKANGVEAADESTMDVDANGEADASTSKKSKKDKKRKRDAAAEFEHEASAVEAGAPAEDLEKKERKRLKKEAKLAEAAKALEHKAAAEMGDVSLAATAAGDVTNADASVLSVNGHGHGSGDADEAERKRLKKEAKAAKKAKKAAA